MSFFDKLKRIINAINSNIPKDIKSSINNITKDLDDDISNSITNLKKKNQYLIFIAIFQFLMAK